MFLAAERTRRGAQVVQAADGRAATRVQRSSTPDPSQGAVAAVHVCRSGASRSQNNLLAERAGADSGLTARQGRRVEVCRSPMAAIRRAGPASALNKATVGRRQLNRYQRRALWRRHRRAAGLRARGDCACRRTISVALREARRPRAYQGCGGLAGSLSLDTGARAAPSLQVGRALRSGLAFPLRATPQSRGDGAKVSARRLQRAANGGRGVATCETGPSRRSATADDMAVQRMSGKSSETST